MSKTFICLPVSADSCADSVSGDVAAIATAEELTRAAVSVRLPGASLAMMRCMVNLTLAGEMNSIVTQVGAMQWSLALNASLRRAICPSE